VVNLKRKLIEKIKSSQNEELLGEIFQILDENDQSHHHLSQEQIKSIKKASAQIERGEFLTQEEVEKEFKKWQKE